MWLLLLGLFTPAHALQHKQSGPILELGAGIGLAGLPVRTALAGQLSVGWWLGPYDDEYALGRFTALVITNQLDYLPATGELRVSPLVEFRRAMDLFVIAPHFFVAVGPVFTTGLPPGIAARVGGGLKLRRTPKLGFIARLAGGVDYQAGALTPSLTFTVGGGYSSPL